MPGVGRKRPGVVGSLTLGSLLARGCGVQATGDVVGFAVTWCWLGWWWFATGTVVYAAVCCVHVGIRQRLAVWRVGAEAGRVDNPVIYVDVKCRVRATSEFRCLDAEVEAHPDGMGQPMRVESLVELVCDIHSRFVGKSDDDISNTKDVGEEEFMAIMAHVKDVAKCLIDGLPFVNDAQHQA